MSRVALAFLAGTLVASPGCAEHRWTERDTHLVLLPVYLAAAHFGEVALHEAGHASTAALLGPNVAGIRVDVLPRRHPGGAVTIGFTELRLHHALSAEQDSLFRWPGPFANAAGHIGARELLVSGQLPSEVQPALAWFALFNGSSAYSEALLGIAKTPGSDMAPSRAWTVYAFAGGLFLYDLWDFFFRDRPDRYVGVLFGQRFYDPDGPSGGRRIRVSLAPTDGGGLVSVGVAW